MPKSLPQKIYDSFSFQEGSRPDFVAMKRHFTPYGLFVNNKGETPAVKPFDEFAASINSNIDAGNLLAVNETEIENQVHLFGKVGHIASRYKLTTKTASGIQMRYGVNLFQVINYGYDWKISCMCWDDYADQRLFDRPWV